MIKMFRSLACVQNVSRRQPMNHDDGRNKLRRCLTTIDLTALGVGGMVGAGLYVLTGAVAKTTTGPSIVISYLIAGLVSLLSAICYAEFACRIPKTGSAYTYVYVSVGELWAFLIGWNLILEYVVASASVARAWSGYFDHLIGNRISNITIEYLLGGHEWNEPFLAKYPDIFGALVLYTVLLVVIFGASVSAHATRVMLFVNILVVFFVLIVGLLYADLANWSVDGGFAPFGVEGIIAGAATLFYAYVGFDVIAMAGEETIDQSKSVPRATYLTVIIATVMYIAVSIALTLLVPYSQIKINSAFASAFDAHGLEWAKYIVGVGALCAMFTTMLGALFCLPRSVYAMASDGILFKFLSKVNERTQVPVIASLVFGTIAAMMTVIFDIAALVEFLSIGVLMAYTIVSGATIRLRYSPLGAELYSLDNKSQEMDEFQTNSSKLDDNRTEGHTEAPVPGTLQEKYHSRFGFLCGYPPGRVVCVCLMSTVAVQFLTILIAKLALEPLKNGAWWAWILVIVGVLLIVVTFIPIPMHHQIEIKSGFKVPFSPWLPALSMMCNIFLTLQLAWITWIRFVVWVIVGLFIYVAYGYRNSVVGQMYTADEADVTYRVLQEDNSSKSFTGGLYGTIERQQPDKNDVNVKGDHKHEDNIDDNL